MTKPKRRVDRRTMRTPHKLGTGVRVNRSYGTAGPSTSTLFFTESDCGGPRREFQVTMTDWQLLGLVREIRRTMVDVRTIERDEMDRHLEHIEAHFGRRTR